LSHIYTANAAVVCLKTADHCRSPQITADQAQKDENISVCK